MKGVRRAATVVVDGYTRFCLTAIAILLSVLIIGLWASGPVRPSQSSAAPPPAEPPQDFTGIGNPAAQRMAVVNAIQTTNQKLDKIISLIESGKIRVIAVSEEEAENVPGQAPKPAK